MIEIINLSVKHKDISILENINLSIQQGEFVLLLGSNGSGKTVLLNSLCGIIPNIISGFEKYGNIYIEEVELTKDSFSYLKNQIGLLMHNPEDQFIGLNVKQEIDFGLNFIKEKEDRISQFNELVVNFGLNDVLNNSIEQLSMGQKQKVLLATLLIKTPKILLLDEPNSFLDDYSLSWLINKLLKLKEKGITIVLSTHNLKSFFNIATKILAIKNGSVLFYESTDLIINDQLREVFNLEKTKIDLLNVE